MFREMEEAGQPAPEYRQNEFMVYDTIRQNGDAAAQLNGELSGTLNDKQKEVLNYITAIPGVQARVIIDKLLIPRDTLNKILKVLTDRDLIEHRGSKKTGGYYPVTKK